MGISWSSGRRNSHIYYHNYPPPPPHLPPPLPYQLVPPAPYYYPADSSLPQPIGPPPPSQNYVVAGNSPYPTTHYCSPPLPINSNYCYPNWYNAASYSNPLTGRQNFHYHGNQSNGWPQMRQPFVSPPPYVEHQTAKKVKNDVNVRKETIRLEIDEGNPGHHLVSFVFDALFEGSITIYYFGKEEAKCKFTPVFPEAYMPVKIPFKKGVGQKFQQPTGTGIDLGFFVLDDLAKPSPEEDVYPLVISAEICSTSCPTDEGAGDSKSDNSPRFQITQAVLEKKDQEPFQVKVIRQILWIDGVRYELRELYGIGSSAAHDFNDDDPGKKCVICMTEPKDTAVLPCRHVCMCSGCAKELRLQSNKCPICRQPIGELIEIKLNNPDQ